MHTATATDTALKVNIVLDTAVNRDSFSTNFD